MILRNVLAATAALSLAAAPAVAEASFARASTPVEGESEAGGGGALLGIFAAVAIIGGIIIAASGDDNDALSQ
ncbi:hypothetical protein [Erythrobacter litoralis]|uniref:Uncharacterized protein n=1 Tax=Erythrobacter litoralis (strain HTCC2594) TaxID=314225 RepID=Q2ND27_ERYLH|nr:hypothetical protein [Erythrobacter litoralis]ABC62414.1 hypothetical protein ELI_01610 [Erythrobacter litoralis HTCC2594]